MRLDTHGKLFQSWGAATAPKELNCVRPKTSVRVSAERNRQTPASVTSRQPGSSGRGRTDTDEQAWRLYIADAVPVQLAKHRLRCCHSHCRVPVISLAAAFCTDCRRRPNINQLVSDAVVQCVTPIQMTSNGLLKCQSIESNYTLLFCEILYLLTRKIISNWHRCISEENVSKMNTNTIYESIVIFIGSFGTSMSVSMWKNKNYDTDPSLTGTCFHK